MEWGGAWVDPYVWARMEAIAKVAIAAGAIGGVALVLRRRREAADAGPKASPCDQLTGWEQAACKVGLGLGGKLADWVKTWGTDQKHAKNVQLNGEVITSLHPALVPQLTGSRGGTSSVGRTIDRPTTDVQYKNGCVPYSGAVGWEKCAAGTVDLAFQSGAGLPTLLHTERAAFDKRWEGIAGRPAYVEHPISCAPGKRRWWNRGEPQCCDAADHRTGAPAPCASLPDGPPRDRTGAIVVGYGAPPPQVDFDELTAGHHTRPIVTDPAHQGYHWIAATSTSGGHWERDRA